MGGFLALGFGFSLAIFAIVVFIIVPRHGAGTDTFRVVGAVAIVVFIIVPRHGAGTDTFRVVGAVAIVAVAGVQHVATRNFRERYVQRAPERDDGDGGAQNPRGPRRGPRPRREVVVVSLVVGLVAAGLVTFGAVEVARQVPQWQGRFVPGSFKVLDDSTIQYDVVVKNVGDANGPAYCTVTLRGRDGRVYSVDTGLSPFALTQQLTPGSTWDLGPFEDSLNSGDAAKVSPAASTIAC